MINLYNLISIMAIFFATSHSNASVIDIIDAEEVRKEKPVLSDSLLSVAEKPKTVITFGTFDLFHIGHLRILERAKSLGNKLVVGISSDAFNMEKKSKVTIFSQEERRRIIGALKCVDEVFFEESFEKKGEYIDQYHADIVVMGDDWLGRFDGIRPHVQTVYFPRTPDISTTQLIHHIKGPEF